MSKEFPTGPCSRPLTCLKGISSMGACCVGGSEWCRNGLVRIQNDYKGFENNFKFLLPKILIRS